MLRNVAKGQLATQPSSACLGKGLQAAPKMQNKLQDRNASENRPHPGSRIRQFVLEPTSESFAAKRDARTTPHSCVQLSSGGRISHHGVKHVMMPLCTKKTSCKNTAVTVGSTLLKFSFKSPPIKH